MLVWGLSAKKFYCLPNISFFKMQRIVFAGLTTQKTTVTKELKAEKEEVVGWVLEAEVAELSRCLVFRIPLFCSRDHGSSCLHFLSFHIRPSLAPSLFRRWWWTQSLAGQKGLSQVDSSYVDDFSADKIVLNRLKEELPFYNIFCHKIALLDEDPIANSTGWFFFKNVWFKLCRRSSLFQAWFKHKLHKLH